MKNLSIVVYGKVQGVNFRHYTREQALELDVKGFVMNRDDGTVYIEAEGTADQLESLIEWCRKGPARAAVTKVETTDGVVKNYSSFEVRRF
ncbi:MAG TPA: acylphosphatase [Cyclobacteriaceae bacterium]|nr:acylphosphatase [Cyclobacteriaceae bacterium]